MRDKPFFCYGVLRILEEEQRLVKEDLLSFGSRNTVTEHVLAGITIVPLESFELCDTRGQIRHTTSIWPLYTRCKRLGFRPAMCLMRCG